MVRLEIEKNNISKAQLAPKLFNHLDIHEGDILSITEPNTGKKAVALASKSNEVLDKRIALSDDHVNSLGVDEGFTVEVTPYREGLVAVREVELGVSPASDGGMRAEDRMLSIKKNERELLQFLGDHIFTINSKFKWDRYDVMISIEDTKPKLRSDDVARFGELDNFRYRWVGKDIKTFNGVLLIDISGSMEKVDMRCEGVDWAIERMEKEFTDLEAQEFFKEVKGKRKISRLNGSLLAALKYLVEKIGRGVGEKIAVLLYTSDAHIVDFGEGNKYYNSSQPPGKIASTLLKEAKQTHHGKTNLLEALNKAKDITKDFPINKMKMIVILTDGKVDNEGGSLDFFRKHIYPRGDIVVNTLGIGDSINEDFLARVANKSGGQYHHVSDLKDLVEKYSEYAMNLEIQGAEEAITSWNESRDVTRKQYSYDKPLCPTCKNGLSFYQGYWYCRACERYIDSIVEKNYPDCDRCGKPLSYFDEEDAWYCYDCEIYFELD